MKKKLTAAIAVAVLFCVLLAVYLLVVVPMMNADDEPEETTAVSLVPGEVEGVRGRIQMFDQITSDKVQSLYVHNSYGTYELVRKDSSLVLKGHENLLLNAEKLAQAVLAGQRRSTSFMSWRKICVLYARCFMDWRFMRRLTRQYRWKKR